MSARLVLGSLAVLAATVTAVTVTAAPAMPPASATPARPLLRAAAAAAPRPAAPGSAQDRARAAARQVAGLTAEYTRRSGQARQASARLGALYRRVEAATDRADAAGARLGAAEALATARVRNLYTRGAGVDGGLALLAAGSPDDALWQLSVGRRIIADLLARSAEQTRRAAADVAAVQTEQDAAQAAESELAQALGSLRADEDAARDALDEARAGLARLDEEARRERAAQEAAAALAAARQQAIAAHLGPLPDVAALDIPPEFAAAYRAAAATCPGLGWTLLAGVGQVESGHGRNDGPSSAGAIGPMQFMPATFAAYGVDGDGDGTVSAWDPEDAVFSAARYLCASGAGKGPDGVHRALLAYNHAEWYVDLVLAAQAAIAARYGS